MSGTYRATSARPTSTGSDRTEILKSAPSVRRKTLQDLRISPSPGRPQPASGGQGLLLDPVRQLSDLVVDRPALSHQRADLAVGVHDRRMIPAAEMLADLRQRQVGELAAQIHRDLASRDQDPRPRGAAEVVDREAEVG